MFRKQFLASTILSLACALLIADTAQAQRLGIFRGRRGGGVSAGSVDVYWGSDGRYGNSWYGDGWYGNRYYGDGWYGNRYYGPGYSDYYGPNYGYSPSYSYSDYYMPSDQEYYGQQGPMDNNIIRVRVIVADPQARIYFDGAPTQQTGTDRFYYTQPLQTTASSTYRLRATWNQNGKEMSQERVINVAPGRMTLVDLTQQQGEQIPRGQEQPQPLPQDTVLEGKILRTGQDQFVIQTGDSREVTVYTNPETRYLRNNNPAVFTDLRAGTSVNVNVRMDGKRHIGNTITIRP